MGEVTLSSQRVRRDIWKVSVSVRNLTPCPAGCTADALQMRSFLSTHAILHVGGGEWLSLLDPPADARDLVPSCLNVGVWPVMVGEAHERDAMLASPIILYDYPKIAPESAGEFFDSTEIDEMLSLRILTMTDGEKQEMRDGDERARRMLERTEQLSSGDLLKLHGVLRELRPLDEEAP
jgi:hydrogenase maturation protease